MVTEDNSRELVYTASDKTRLVPSNDSMCPFFMKTLDDKSSLKAHTQKTHRRHTEDTHHRALTKIVTIELGRYGGESVDSKGVYYPFSTVMYNSNGVH